MENVIKRRKDSVTCETFFGGDRVICKERGNSTKGVELKDAKNAKKLSFACINDFLDINHSGI